MPLSLFAIILSVRLNKELIINSSAQGVQIALLEDKKLVELHNEKADASFNVGDLYLGRVKKLIPGLNAAFVDVGFEKDAFLHYTDLSPFAKSLLKFTQLSINSPAASQPNFSTFTVEAEIVKTGKINEVLGQKPNVLVQILKEPIAAKGPRLSCEISLPGRFVVITPFNDIIAVSRKIHSAEERKRLQKIIEAIKPKNFGVIVRTAAEGKNTAELHEDLNVLFSKWKSIQQNLSGAVAPAKILSEQTKATSILRDLLNADFNKIVVNDKQIYADTKAYIQKIAPDKAEIVSLYTGSASVFDHTGITKQVKGAFGKTVNLPSGAYLIIEHTEALHVIDVNSGNRSNRSKSQEETAFEVNMIATKDGNPVSVTNPFPVSLGSSNITIVGNITIPGIVTVTSSAGNPIHNHIVEVGTSGTITTPYIPIGISTLLNTVSISNTSFFVTGFGSSVSIANTAFYILNPVTTVAVSSIASTVTVVGFKIAIILYVVYTNKYNKILDVIQSFHH